MTKLQAVTFDVWQTLLHEQPGRPRTDLRVAATAAVLRRAVSAVDDALLREAYAELLAYCTREWQTREVGPDEQLRWVISRVLRDGNIQLDRDTWAALESAYVDPIFLDPPDLAPYAELTLLGVRALGLRVGLICNTGFTPGYALRELFDRWGILNLFDDLAFSNEEGVRKPSRELFERVARRLEVEPGAVVHVGDDLIADIAGAKAAGYRAVLVRPAVPESIPVEPDAIIANLSELRPILERWVA